MAMNEVESKHLSHLFADRQSLSQALQRVTVDEAYVSRLITAMHSSLVVLAELQDERKQVALLREYEQRKEAN